MVLHQRPLRTIYDILSPTNSTLLTAYTILWCTKIPFAIDDFRFLFHRKIIIICFTVPPFSHLTSCRYTKSNIHLVKSLAYVASEPVLYRLLTFQVPNLPHQDFPTKILYAFLISPKRPTSHSFRLDFTATIICYKQ